MTTTATARASNAWRMPAEWEPHAATWIAWPHNRSDWPGKHGPIPWVAAEVTRHLCDGERVRVIVQHEREERGARRALGQAGVDLAAVDFHRLATDRHWLRDSGAIFTVSGTTRGPARRATAFRFNGWAKYSDYRRDARVPALMARAAGVPLHPVARVMEGGAIDVDGEGTLLATEECLLSAVQARNPGLGRAGSERLFAAELGVRRVIWLEAGILGDDTHGHIDDVARFVAPGRVVVAEERDPRDPNHAILAACRERLGAARDAAGRRLDVIPLPMPAPIVFAGQRLPASYANFYIGNTAVLVPTFNDPADRIALGTLAGLFPGRRVVGVHARDLVLGLGTIHCMTQQEPAVTLE